MPVRRVDMVVGSAEWAVATVEHAKRLWHSRENTQSRWLEAVGELEGGRAWVPLGKQTLDELLIAEIGLTAVESIHHASRADAVRAAAEATDGNQVLKPGAGLNQHTGKERLVQIAPGTIAGRAADRGVSRRTQAKLDKLAREAPDVLQAYQRGEHRSVTAAAKAAGLVKDPTPLQQLRRWWTKASTEERHEFLRGVA